MGQIIHAFDPALDGVSNPDPKPARFEIYGASWPQAFYVDLLRQTERQIAEYRAAVEDPGKDLNGPRERMEGFLGNALKIMQTIERGHVAEEDWRAFKEERMS